MPKKGRKVYHKLVYHKRKKYIHSGLTYLILGESYCKLQKVKTNSLNHVFDIILGVLKTLYIIKSGYDMKFS